MPIHTNGSRNRSASSFTLYGSPTIDYGPRQSKNAEAGDFLSSYHNITPGSPALGIQDVQENPPPSAQVLSHQIQPERNANSSSGSKAFEPGLSHDCFVLELTDGARYVIPRPL